MLLFLVIEVIRVIFEAALRIGLAMIVLAIGLILMYIAIVVLLNAYEEKKKQQKKGKK